MAASVKFPPRFLKRIARLGAAVDDMEAELIPLLQVLMDEDNEEGLLAGLDKDSQPLAPLAKSTLKDKRRGPGGPLIPRDRLSRPIANYEQGSIEKRGRGRYVLVGAWRNVLSKKGIPFLPFHFEGRGHNPVRDIRGVRKAGKDRIRKAMIAWLLQG